MVLVKMKTVMYTTSHSIGYFNWKGVQIIPQRDIVEPVAELIEPYMKYTAEHVQTISVKKP